MEQAVKQVSEIMGEEFPIVVQSLYEDIIKYGSVSTAEQNVKQLAALQKLTEIPMAPSSLYRPFIFDLLTEWENSDRISWNKRNEPRKNLEMWWKSDEEYRDFLNKFQGYGVCEQTLSTALRLTGVDLDTDIIEEAARDCEGRNPERINFIKQFAAGVSSSSVPTNGVAKKDFEALVNALAAVNPKIRTGRMRLSEDAETYFAASYGLRDGYKLWYRCRGQRYDVPANVVDVACERIIDGIGEFNTRGTTDPDLSSLLNALSIIPQITGRNPRIEKEALNSFYQRAVHPLPTILKDGECAIVSSSPLTLNEVREEYRRANFYVAKAVLSVYAASQVAPTFPCVLSTFRNYGNYRDTAKIGEWPR